MGRILISHVILDVLKWIQLLHVCARKGWRKRAPGGFQHLLSPEVKLVAPPSWKLSLYVCPKPRFAGLTSLRERAMNTKNGIPRHCQV